MDINLSAYDAQVLEHACKTGAITPDQYPGKKNASFRLLIRALR